MAVITALESALLTVSVVFLLGALLYGYRLSRLTKGAEIVALAKPKTFFASILVAFASLLASQLVQLLNELAFSIAYAAEIAQLLVIVTAFAAVVGLYMAVYYYRISPRKVSTYLSQKQSS